VRKATRIGTAVSPPTNQSNMDNSGNIARTFTALDLRSKDATIALVQSAFDDGLVPIDGEQQYEFLCSYQELEKRNKSLQDRSNLYKGKQLTSAQVLNLMITNSLQSID